MCLMCLMNPVSYAKKKKPGENGDVRSLRCKCKGFGLRARVVGSSSAVVPSPWRLLHRRWKAKDWRRQGASHQRGNDSGNAKERQRPTTDNEQRLGRGKPCQCGGNQKVRTKQEESPTKQQGWTEQDIYKKRASGKADAPWRQNASKVLFV